MTISKDVRSFEPLSLEQKKFTITCYVTNVFPAFQRFQSRSWQHEQRRHLLEQQQPQLQQQHQEQQNQEQRHQQQHQKQKQEKQETNEN